MDVCTIDFSETSVASLPSYTGEVYRACLKMLPETVNELYEDVQIVQVLDTVKKQPTPSFRYAEVTSELQIIYFNIKGIIRYDLSYKQK